MSYKYKVVQVPSLEVVRGAQVGDAVAQCLETILNRHAQEGWEFYRVDCIGVRLFPQAEFSGHMDAHTSFHVVTFRKPV